MKPSEYAKATTGAVLAGLGSLGTALADGTVTGAEWVAVAIAVVATFGTVFGVRNSTAGRRRKVQGGYSALYVLWCIVLALAAVVLLTWLL